MTRFTLTLLTLLLALPAAGQLPQCLVPADPSTCDPAWVPNAVDYPQLQETGRIQPSAAISVKDGEWRVVLTLETQNHPGTVKLAVVPALTVETWTRSPGSAGVFITEIRGAVSGPHNITVEWQNDGVIYRRSLYLRQADAASTVPGVTGPWWNWSLGTGTLWPSWAPEELW